MNLSASVRRDVEQRKSENFLVPVSSRCTLGFSLR